MTAMTVLSGQGIRGNYTPGGVIIAPPIVTVPSQPSGFALPTADLDANFELTWLEDFDRTVAESPVTTNGTASAFDLEYGTNPNNDLAGGTKIVLGAYPSTYLDTSDRGRYGTAILSVAPGSSILRERVRYEAGWPRVCAWIPRLGNLIGAPYGQSDVLGGAFELVWRAEVINGYKFVPLWWPKTNHRQTASGVDAGGEMDFPEVNLFGGDLIHAYIHWQGDVTTDTTTEQSTYTSTVVGAGSGWHKTLLVWTPGVMSTTYPTRSVGGNVKLYLDGVLVRTVTGSPNGVTGPFIPSTPMHMVVQQEVRLGGTVDQTSFGNVDIDWAAFYKFKGTPG